MVEGQEGLDWGAWVALARAAEEAGLDALFRSDHYLSIVRGAPAGALDAWATLAALAAVTERIRLGTLVSPVTFRPAAVLAKNAVTVDHISGGRVELGIGGGWYEAEHAAYRLPFPSVRERMDELDRQLEEIAREWGEAGDVFPRPVQRPHPPIIVGGKAKPRTVRAAVRWADEYNTFAATVEEVRERKRIVDQAAAAAGREPLRFSVMVSCIVGRDRAEVGARLRAVPVEPAVAGTVEEVAEALRAFEAAGAYRVMLQDHLHEDVDMVAAYGEVARELA